MKTKRMTKHAEHAFNIVKVGAAFLFIACMLFI